MEFSHLDVFSSSGHNHCRRGYIIMTWIVAVVYKLNVTLEGFEE